MGTVIKKLDVHCTDPIMDEYLQQHLDSVEMLIEQYLYRVSRKEYIKTPEMKLFDPNRDITRAVDEFERITSRFNEFYEGEEEFLISDILNVYLRLRELLGCDEIDVYDICAVSLKMPAIKAKFDGGRKNPTDRLVVHNICKILSFAVSPHYILGSGLFIRGRMLSMKDGLPMRSTVLLNPVYMDMANSVKPKFTNVTKAFITKARKELRELYK